MSSESSSDGTYSSESESVSSASDISSIPSLTAASSSSSAPPTTDGDSEFATDSEPEATASDSDSDSNPFGDLEESDSSTDDEVDETGVDPDVISATVDGMSAEDRAALAAAVGIEPDELATYVQHMHSMPRDEFAEIASRSAALAREVVARAGGRPQSIEQAGQLADEVIAEADEGGLDDDEGDEEEESPTEATGLRRRRQPIERVRRARREGDALACFRFAERMANESPHRQDDVRWALAFHEMLELKLGAEEEPGPHRSWVGEDWAKLAEPCLQRRLAHDFGVKVKVDLARLALVAVAARQIARGRAGAEEPQPKWRLRWPVIATALVVDASVDADLDNVDLRVRAYALRSHHREGLSPPLLVAAANVSAEPHLLSPFMNPFANHRGNEIGWCIVACWAMMLLVRLEPPWLRPPMFPFALAALAAFFSSRVTSATTTWSVRAQRLWADRVNCAALLVAVFALVRLVAYYFRPPPWTMEWSVPGGFAVACSGVTLGLDLLLLSLIMLPRESRVYESTGSGSGSTSRRPRRGGSHEYLLSFNASNGCPTTTSNRFFADSRATVTCDGHGVYAHRHRVVAFVTALVALEVFKVVPLWLHAALLLAFGTRLGFTCVPGAFWIASVMYSAVAGELDAAAYLFGLDSTCRGLSRIVGSRVAALVYAAGTLALAYAYYLFLWVRYSNHFSWWLFCVTVIYRNIAKTDDDPRRLWWPQRFMNGLRGRAIIELGEPIFYLKLARMFWGLLCLIASGVSMAYTAMRPGFLPFVLGSGCGGAVVSIWGWASIRNTKRKCLGYVREAEDITATHKAAADDARKARESADARAAAAIKDVASAEARLRAAELARHDAVARAAAEVARADDGTDGAERWAARLAEADIRRAAEREKLCKDVAAAHAERDAARAALAGRAELEPRLRLALERRQLGTVADKFVVEGVLDAAAARRLTDDDFQRFGYLSFSLSSGPVADIRAAVDEAFSADLILEGGEAPKDLLCPLTLEIFEDPVVAVDGHTYERAAIEKWFQSKATSPLTNARITTELVPAHCVRSLADRYRVTVADPPPAPAPAAPDFTTPLLANSRAPQPTWTFPPPRAAAPAPAAGALTYDSAAPLQNRVATLEQMLVERDAFISQLSATNPLAGLPPATGIPSFAATPAIVDQEEESSFSGSSVGMPETVEWSRAEEEHLRGGGGAPPPSDELGLPSDSYESDDSGGSSSSAPSLVPIPSAADRSAAGYSDTDTDSSASTDSSDSDGSSSSSAPAAAPLASPRSRRAAQAARAAELRALAAATNSEVDVPVRQAADDAPATPPAQLVMGGPLPRQPARVASNPELVVGTDPEMEHPPAVTPDAAN